MHWTSQLDDLQQRRSSWGWNFPLRQGVSLFHQTAGETPVFTLAHTHALYCILAWDATKTTHICMRSRIHALVLSFSPSPLLFYSGFLRTLSASHGTFRAWTPRVSKSGHSCWIFSPVLSSSSLTLSAFPFSHSPTLDSSYFSPLSFQSYSTSISPCLPL